jgi:hypothetical protein
MPKKKIVALMVAVLFAGLFLPNFIVSGLTDEIQEIQPTLTVSSGPGGTITVNSSAINQGQPVIIDQGAEQSWAVPSGTQVTLKATVCSAGLEFRGWTGPLNGNPRNPGIITVDSSENISSVFEGIGAPNSIGVTLAYPQMTTQNSLAINFTVENGRAPYTVMQEIYGITLYLDTIPVSNIQWSNYSSNPGAICEFNTTIPASMVSNGTHNLYVLAKTSFYTPNPMAIDPGPPCDGSAVSNMAIYPQETPKTSPSQQETSHLSNSPTITIAGVAVAILLITSIGIIIKKRKINKTEA